MNANWFNRLLGIHPPASVPRVQFQQFSLAQFNWHRTPQAWPVPLIITFQTLKTGADGWTEAELNINHAGIRAQAMVQTDGTSTFVYLGNYFWVPDTFKRQGLASAMIVALAQAFDLAQSGTKVSRPIFLEGYFVGEGAPFSESICDQAPKKGMPAVMREAAVRRARQQLSLSVAPALTIPNS